MHPGHIAVSAVCLLCGLSAVVGYLVPSPGLLGSGVFFGYWATLAAIVIAIFVAGLLLDRARKGQAQPFIRRSWLGLANGGVALMFWLWVIAYGS